MATGVAQARPGAGCRDIRVNAERHQPVGRARPSVGGCSCCFRSSVGAVRRNQPALREDPRLCHQRHRRADDLLPPVDTCGTAPSLDLTRHGPRIGKRRCFSRSAVVMARSPIDSRSHRKVSAGARRSLDTSDARTRFQPGFLRDLPRAHRAGLSQPAKPPQLQPAMRIQGHSPPSTNRPGRQKTRATQTSPHQERCTFIRTRKCAFTCTPTALAGRGLAIQFGDRFRLRLQAGTDEPECGRRVCGTGHRPAHDNM